MQRLDASQLFVNGKVFTGRGEHDRASAFRITDGAFSWVGDQAEVRGESAVDLGGRTVIPGLLDVHTHPAVLTRLANAVDCLPPVVTSIDQLLARLRTHPSFGKGDSHWIEGYGFDDSRFAEHRPPTARDLDRVSASQPILVRRCDGHSAVCNTRALELAGITAGTDDPPGARFERDHAGEPTGYLTEIAAVDAVGTRIPTAGYDQQVSHLVRLSDHFLSRGITGVCDLLATALPAPLQMFREAERQGFRPRCTLYYAWDAVRAQALPDLTDDDRHGRIRFGGLKLFMDGAYSNRTAWVREPYPESDDCGMQTLPDEQAYAAMEWARRNQVQVAIHAMGDQAVEHVIDLFGGEQPWLADRPSIRIEHATLVSAETIAHLNRSRMSFGVVTHTIFYFAEYDAYRNNLSESQSRIAYPVRSLYDAVPLIALSSDNPATAWSNADNVFVSIRAAVERRAYNGADIGRESAITVPQALLLYTARAREVARLGHVGLICPGYEGSFVVLDRDVFDLPVSQIDQVRVAETWIAGARVFAA